jgi:POT family proton-dependent oligopeptide transporter
MNTIHDKAQVKLSRVWTAHPQGLRVIFFTEMWERFSYYGMRSLLVLYLVKALNYQRGEALAIFGTYAGLVYLTPIFGGAIADKYLGKRRAIFVGASLMVLGHFCMAFEHLLLPALGLLIVGNGFFKPNTTSLVGDLYCPNQAAQRAGGYSIFYMGINLGAFLAPLVAGTVGEMLGWHYGFACAGIGMTLGLIQLWAGQESLGQAGLLPGQSSIGPRDLRLLLAWIIGCVVFVFACIFAWSASAVWTAQWPAYVKTLAELGIFVLALVFLFKPSPTSHQELSVGSTHSRDQSLSRAEWYRVISIVVVMLFVIVFWTGFEQAGGTLTLFADKNTERDWLGVTVPASAFQAINPALIILLAPVFSIIWSKLDAGPYAINDIAKQALGMIVLGLGFVIMARAQVLADEYGKVGPQWLIMVYAVHTLGELMLSPVGLSMVSRVAPAKLGAMLMGVWMLASAIAGYMAGSLENILKSSAYDLYPFLATISIAAGTILLFLSSYLQKLMSVKEG